VSPSTPPARVHFVDACRALAVFGMLFANMMNVFIRQDLIPPVLTHNEGDVLRAFDFPAPIFQFLIGVSLVLFLERRRNASAAGAGARGLAFRRFTLLVALGIVLDSFGALDPWPHWGVLQTLGLGGAAATALAAFPDVPIAAVGFGLLALFSGAANGEVHRSPLAAFAFVPLTLAGLVVGRGLLAGRPRPGFVRRAVVVAAAGVAFAAVARGAGVPFNKVLGTSSFVALASAVSSLLLLAISALEAAGMVFPSWLLALGSNALMAWVLMYVLVYYPAWLAFPAWGQLPFVPGLAVVVATLVTLSALTVRLARRGIRIPL